MIRSFSVNVILLYIRAPEKSLRIYCEILIKILFENEKTQRKPLNPCIVLIERLFFRQDDADGIPSCCGALFQILLPVRAENALAAHG